MLHRSLVSKPRDKRDYIGMSAVGRCRRQTYLFYHEDRYPVERDYQSLLVFREGDRAEEHIIDDLQDAGIPVYGNQLEVNWPLYPELVKGHIDGLIQTDTGTILLEVKTAHPFAFSKLTKSETGIIDTWPHYYMQAQTYMHCLQTGEIHLDSGLPLSGPVTQAVFLVKDKGSAEIAEQWIGYDPGYIEREVEPRVATLARAVNNDSPPPRDYNISHAWQCKKQYCPFRDICKQMGD